MSKVTAPWTQSPIPFCSHDIPCTWVLGCPIHATKISLPLFLLLLGTDPTSIPQLTELEAGSQKKDWGESCTLSPIYLGHDLLVCEAASGAAGVPHG